jgi:asparagine synthase (glutamine-hydrolysing)
MCGFIGRLNLHRPVRELTAGLPFLGRRGPDSHRQQATTDGRVEFLHARLAIVDRSAVAHQPFIDPESCVMIAFVGEIYNYAALRQELAGYPFRTQSDTEVLLAGYVRHGLAWFERLRGMFSVAIADERRRRLFLVRDPVGKKPLFVGRWRDGIYFGTTTLAMASAAAEPVKLGAGHLAAWWKAGHFPATASAVADTEAVPPGEAWEFDWEGKRIARLRCDPPLPQEAPPRSVAEATERLAQLLAQAVRRRLDNNPKPIALMSGGVDSTIIAQHLVAQTQPEFLALGNFVPGTFDELYARYAGRRLSVPVQILRPSLKSLPEEIMRSLDLQDEPLALLSYFPLAMLCRLAADHGRVLLTGDGGDEVFLGYGAPADWTDRSAEDTDAAPPLRCGPPLPEWFSGWARHTATEGLVGHMHAKLDRASAEQGLEARCPFLDWDVMAFARSLPRELLFHRPVPKALLKSQLTGWPGWFVDRPKMGFSYSLRWGWGTRGFAGLREMVEPEAQAAFAEHVPAALRQPAAGWSHFAIFRNFPAAWRLATWSLFLRRLRTATRR